MEFLRIYVPTKLRRQKGREALFKIRKSALLLTKAYLTHSPSSLGEIFKITKFKIIILSHAINHMAGAIESIRWGVRSIKKKSTQGKDDGEPCSL